MMLSKKTNNTFFDEMNLNGKISIHFQIISELPDVDYCVVANVSDMGGGNQGLWGSFDKSIGEMYFNVSVSSKSDLVSVTKYI